MTDLQWQSYVAALRRGNFQKLARLRFLNPDGTTAFAVDNDPKNPRSGAFLRSGSVTVNLQNGVRRQATVELAILDDTFVYSVNHIWFGTEIAVDMGLLLPDGTEFYLPQGVFRVDGPKEAVNPNGSISQFSLIDKWGGIDGTLNGVLESSYAVSEGTNIFAPIAAILKLDRGDGQPYDGVPPVFTEYYNGKTQVLPGGGTAPLTNTAHDLIVDSDNGTVADVILKLCGMVNAWVGYDRTGRLRVEPSQDDILDADKPVSWRFSLSEAQVTGLAYDFQIGEVCNDYIVMGYMTDDYAQPGARAVNNDPTSPVCVERIGRRTIRDPKPEFATVQMCADYAEWKVKRTGALHKAVNVTANQIFHLEENTLIELVRTDKPNAPTERHLIQGYTIPFSGAEPMTIQAVSVQDFPQITVYTTQ